MRKSCGNRAMLALGFSIGLAGAAAVQPAAAADAPPVFSATAQTGWVGIGIGAFLPVPGSPKPIAQDPAHPYISNDQAAVTKEQPNQRISDIGNLNLKQWAKDEMKKDNAGVLAGGFAYTARSACAAAGVPGFDVLLGGALYILQSPTEVTMIFFRKRRNAAYPAQCAALGQSETLVVRRLGRPLRGRCACRRHHRAQRQDVPRQLSNAAYRSAACHGTLASDRRRQEAGNPHRHR